MKTYCFKLYHSKRNRELHRLISLAGIIYNHCIALHKRYYRLYHKSLNKYSLQKHITKLKKTDRYKFWNQLGSQAIQDIAERIDRAYKLFFNNLKRGVRTAPPSFQKVSKYKSFTLKQTGWKYLGSDNSLIIMGRRYKFSKSREIEGKIKLITIKRDPLGDLYIYFICDVQENEVPVRSGESAGFDFGVKVFLTGIEPEQDIEAPLFFRQNANEVKRASRKLSSKQKGSKNRRKARLNLARVYKKVGNKRSDFHWKLARELCSKYAVICFEDLNLKAMQKRYGRKIMDLGFAEFLNRLEYIAKKLGTRIVKISRFYPSSQLCHVCGHRTSETKNLNVREWDCPACGEHHDRDRNAAINILREGERILQSA